MSDFISFSAYFCRGHENIRDIALRDQLLKLVPAIAKPVVAVTIKEGTRKIEVELEKLEGYRPTLYVDIEELVSRENGSIYRSLTMDEETGYITDMNWDASHGITTAHDSQFGDYVPEIFWTAEMDFTATVTQGRVDEIRHEIDSLFAH